MLNDLLVASDSVRVSVLKLLDISAAFDTIDHCILLDLHKNNFKMSGSVPNWFQSYLLKRQQITCTYGVQSDKAPLHFGVI